MTKRELSEKFFGYVKDLSVQNNLTEEFKEFERLFMDVKDYRLAFVYYTKTIRQNESLTDKTLEGDFFKEYIW